MATGVFAVEIPVSTVQSAVGAAYAIPADRYGVVRAHVQDGETFLINGVTVLSSRALDITSSVTTTNGGGSITSPTVGSARVFHGEAFCSTAGVGQLTVSGAPLSGAPVGLFAFTMGPGVSASLSGGGGASPKSIVGYERGVDNTGFAQTFRLPAGATISGGRYHVELYRIPGSAT
jgi:hypothetical protein